MTSKVAFIGLAVVFLCFAFGSVAQPAIPKDMHNIKCGVCHGDGGGGHGEDKPLKAEYQGNQGCVNCHSSSADSTTYTLDVSMHGDGSRNIDVPVVVYTGANPPANYLAGGNFWWVVDDDDTIGRDDSKGHNIFSDNPESNLTQGAPGLSTGCNHPGSCHHDLDTEDTTYSTRQGCTKCHMMGGPPSQFDDPHPGTEPRGYHHADDSNQVVGSEEKDPDGFFRFLSGHMGGQGHGVSGIEDDDWQATSSSSDHNEYLGYSASKNAPGILSNAGHTVTGFCGGCHGNFHWSSDSPNGGDWLRHPAEAVLCPDGLDGCERAGYSAYNPLAPVARPDLNVFTLADTDPDKRYPNEVSPGVDLTNCLSCHCAHGSPYPKMLRWDPTDTDGSCLTCHTNKVPDTHNQYHHVADCNVCHTMHGEGPPDYYPPYTLELIKNVISTPNSGNKDVVFKSRPEDFADGDTTYDGVCEVCHTSTYCHRNDGSDGREHFDGQICTDCHPHDSTEFSAPYPQSHSTHLFVHKGPLIDCIDCHVDPADPDDPSEYSTFCDGQNLASTSACDACHSPGGRLDGIDDADIGAKPNWAAAVYDATGDTLKAGKEAWCLGCHDDDPTTDTNESAVIDGVYAPSIAGVSVSDESWYTPASLVSGLNNLIDGSTTTGNTRMTRQTVFNLGDHYRVTDIRVYMKDAPNGIFWQVFAGDGSSWTRILGTENPRYGWKTGHAGAGWYQAKTDLSVTAQYLRIDYVTPGPCYRNTVFEVQYRRDNLCYGHLDTGHKIKCSYCHDFATAHIDGDARTYEASTGNYQEGYRLKLANAVPREIPVSSPGVDPADFALCFDCHDNTAFLDGSRMDLTNFRADGNPINDHFRHLGIPHGSEYFFDSDFDGVADSDMTCTACHNVHGSPTPGMVRHGELINKIPGLNLRYLDINGDPDGYISSGSNSYGAETYYWASGPGTVDKNGICLMCHNDYICYTRVWSEDVTLPTGFQVISLCPVDLRLIDPEGLIVDKFLNEIIGASYFEGDIDGDGSRDDRILIPNRKNGEYTILVLPESNPDPGDKDIYTLKAMVGDQSVVLAEDVPIGIPGSEDLYTVTSTESGMATPYIGLVSPENGALLPKKGFPTFSWDSEGYQEFKVELSKEPDFLTSDIVALPSQGWLSGPPFTPTKKEWKPVEKMAGNNGRVYWRVIGKDSEGTLAFSETFTFTIESAHLANHE